MSPSTSSSVTGGSGFIGSQRRRRAASTPAHDVRVLDPQPPHRDDVDWRPVDVLDLDGLTEALDGSGPVVPPRRDGRRQRRHRRPGAGDPGQRRRHRQRARGGPPRRRRPGRPGQHGLGLRRDHAASASTRTTLFDPDTNRHLYVSTKIAAEMACRDYLTLYGRPFTVLRLRHPVRAADAADHACWRRSSSRALARRAAAHRRRRPPAAQLRLRRRPRPGLRPGAARRRRRTCTFNIDGAEPVSIRQLAELTPGAGARRRWSSSGPRAPATSAPRGRRQRAGRRVLGWTPRRRHRRRCRRTLRLVRASGPSADPVAPPAVRGLRLIPAASPSSRVQRGAAPSPRCSTSCTSWSTSSWSSTTARPTTRGAEIEAWLPVTTTPGC